MALVVPYPFPLVPLVPFPTLLVLLQKHFIFQPRVLHLSPTVFPSLQISATLPYNQLVHYLNIPSLFQTLSAQRFV